MIRVTLHPTWVGGARYGYVYDVTLDGEVIVSRSHDPEYDAARALLARGLTGRFETIDSKTGKPRMRFDIEKAAGLCVVEEDGRRPRLRRWSPPGSGASTAAPPLVPVPTALPIQNAPLEVRQTHSEAAAALVQGPVLPEEDN